MSSETSPDLRISDCKLVPVHISTENLRAKIDLVLPSFIYLGQTLHEQVNGFPSQEFKGAMVTTGNVSVDLGDGSFAITKAGGNKIEPNEGHIVIVKSLNDKEGIIKIFSDNEEVDGPSSESSLHLEVRKYTGAKYVAHIHDMVALEAAQSDPTFIPTTEGVITFASLSEAEQVGRLAQQNPKGICMRNHGFVYFGNTPKEVVKSAVYYHRKAIQSLYHC